jgi:hypothetical protein
MELKMNGNEITSEGMIPLFNALSKGVQNLNKLDISQNT